MKKKLKGFTLVELIVVLAIIVVLTGVLVPSATYFIRQSKLKTANAQAKVVFNAALTVSQEYEAKNKTVMNTANGNPSGYTISSGNIQDFTNLGKDYATLGGSLEDIFIRRVWEKVVEVPGADEDVWAVRYTDNGDAFPVLTGACYSTTDADRYVGCYPENTPSSGFAGTYQPLISTDYWLDYASSGVVTP